MSFDMPNILEKQKGAKHAGEVETSVMLFLYPEKVRKKDIKDFEMSFEDFKPYLMHEKIETIENSPGCQGYPSFASVEKGKVLFSLMIKACSKLDSSRNSLIMQLILS